MYQVRIVCIVNISNNSAESLITRVFSKILSLRTTSIKLKSVVAQPAASSRSGPHTVFFCWRCSFIFGSCKYDIPDLREKIVFTEYHESFHFWKITSSCIKNDENKGHHGNFWTKVPLYRWRQRRQHVDEYIVQRMLKSQYILDTIVPWAHV